MSRKGNYWDNVLGNSNDFFKFIDKNVSEDGYLTYNYAVSAAVDK